MKNSYISIYEVVEQTAVKVCCTGRADEILDDKLYKLTDRQDIKQGLLRHLMNS